MLNNLTIVNGILEPAFDSKVNNYTVYVDKDVISLVMEYDSGDYATTVYGNDYLTEGENHVYIEVADKEVNTYVLTVYKKESQEAFNETDLLESYEIDVNDYPTSFITPFIGLICFISIMALFWVIFKRK